MYYRIIWKTVKPIINKHFKRKLTHKPMETQEENTKKKSISIKNCLKTDKDYLDYIISDHADITAAEAFSIIVQHSKNFLIVKNSNADLKLEINKITEEKTTLNADIEGLIDDNKNLNTSLNESLKENEKLKSEIELQKNKQPEQIPIELQGSQFICELEEKTALNMLRVKKLVLADNYISESGENYPNALVNFATKFFLSRVYTDKIEL